MTAKSKKRQQKKVTRTKSRMEAPKMDVRTRKQEIEEFLESNGAVLFSKLLREVPILYRAISDPKLFLIFAPDDNIMRQFLKIVEKTAGSLLRSTAAIEVLGNHVMLAPPKNGTYRSINGLTFNLPKEYRIRLGKKIDTVIDGVGVAIISRPIVLPAQVKKLLAVKTPGVIGTLDYQNFLNLIQLGGLKGKDLIAFCLSNSAVNNMCNKTDENGKDIFDRLLLTEFGLSRPYRQTHTSRESYVLLYKTYRVFTSEYTRIKPGRESDSFSTRYIPFVDDEKDEPFMDAVQIVTVNLIAKNGYCLFLDSTGDVFISELEKSLEPLLIKMSKVFPLRREFVPKIKEIAAFASSSSIYRSNSYMVLLDETGQVVIDKYIMKKYTRDYRDDDESDEDEDDDRKYADFQWIMENGIRSIRGYGRKLYMIDVNGRLLIYRLDGAIIPEGEYVLAGDEVHVQFIDIPSKFVKLGRGLFIDGEGFVYRDMSKNEEPVWLHRIEGMVNAVEIDLLDQEIGRPDQEIDQQMPFTIHNIPIASISSDGALSIVINGQVTTYNTDPEGKRFSNIWVNIAYTSDMTPYQIRGNKLFPAHDVISDRGKINVPPKFLYYQTIGDISLFLTQ